MHPALIFYYIYCFIFGSIVASFVNVVIYRLPRGISIIKGRSYCTNCHHVLQIRDLVPVVSYILLRGKCRYCHTKISLVHPLVEMSGGILSIFCFCHYGLSLTCLFVFVLSMAFLAISIIDIETMTIPNQLNITIGILALLSMFIWHRPFFSRVLGAAFSGTMLLMNFVKEDSFGGGDIKLCFFTGFMLGIVNMTVAMLIAILSGGFCAMILIIIHQVKLKAIWTLYLSRLLDGTYIWRETCIILFTPLLLLVIHAQGTIIPYVKRLKNCFCCFLKSSSLLGWTFSYAFNI